MRPVLLLSVGCLAVLLGTVDGKKKSPARKVGFLKTADKRSKYATWVFEQYDEDANGKLTEAEIDEANDQEPPVQISSDAEDTLELFDLDLLDKDPVDKRVSRAELLAKLENLEERRLAAIQGWCVTARASLRAHLAAGTLCIMRARVSGAVGKSTSGISKKCGRSLIGSTRSVRRRSTRRCGRTTAGRALRISDARKFRTRTCSI